ncbi:NUDIX hydrolase [Miniimonas arenae]|uniref:NUDIX hydrolase n=1 Tax=Miniimonas arenae TaxID=676201 RepID=UPI0028B1806C|nr:NUDIX hydrolase [Miniimonas arenae]
MSLPPRAGHRDPNDAWVDCACGRRHWGLAGAAGLLLVDGSTAPDGEPRVALQLRAAWSHHGGTWGLPGGAVQTGEDALTAAWREAREEAAIPPDAGAPAAVRVLDHGTWRYTTLVARVHGPAPELLPLDGESADLRWVPVDEVAGLDLLPAFGEAWPALRRLVEARPTLLVDAANVVGARPDGWWRDRAGATERLLTSLARGARELPGGAWYPGAWFDLDADGVRPDVHVVTEGRGNAATPPDEEVTVHRAPGSGDDAIAALAGRLLEAGADPLVVATADRGLRARLPGGARALGPGTLRDALERG